MHIFRGSTQHDLKWHFAVFINKLYGSNDYFLFVFIGINYIFFNAIIDIIFFWCSCLSAMLGVNLSVNLTPWKHKQKSERVCQQSSEFCIFLIHDNYDFFYWLKILLILKIQFFETGNSLLEPQNELQCLNSSKSNLLNESKTILSHLALIK